MFLPGQVSWAGKIPNKLSWEFKVLPSIRAQFLHYADCDSKGAWNSFYIITVNIGTPGTCQKQQNYN